MRVSKQAFSAGGRRDALSSGGETLQLPAEF
jgi:hypothetical protein